MKVLLLVAAQSAVVDQSTGAISLFNIIQEINSPSFPLAIPSFSLAIIFSRESATDPDPTDVTCTISRGTVELMNQHLQLRFQGRTGLRYISNLQGMLIMEPGDLSVRIFRGSNELASWPIGVNHIGNAELRASTE